MISPTIPIARCERCRAGITRLDEDKFWTGHRCHVAGVKLRHWCDRKKFQDLPVSILSATAEGAIREWNERQRPPQGFDEE